MRALIDMGASVFLPTETEYRRLRNRRWIRRPNIEIIPADGGPMGIGGW